MKSRETSQQGKAEKQRSREKQKNWKASKPGTRNPGKKKTTFTGTKNIFEKKCSIPFSIRGPGNKISAK